MAFLLRDVVLFGHKTPFFGKTWQKHSQSKICWKLLNKVSTKQEILFPSSVATNTGGPWTNLACQTNSVSGKVNPKVCPNSGVLKVFGHAGRRWFYTSRSLLRLSLVEFGEVNLLHVENKSSNKIESKKRTNDRLQPPSGKRGKTIHQQWNKVFLKVLSSFDINVLTL